MGIYKHTKIFTALSFLRIRSPDLLWYQWIYPSALTILIICVFHFSNKIIIISSKEIISDINSIMGALIGFYIASLAAVATFSSENLDRELKGRPLEIKSNRQGKILTEKLTRRRFLSIVFGYCVTISISIYVIGIFYSNSYVAEHQSDYIVKFIEYTGQILFTFYIWMISSLLASTLLGLHYLVERMHRE